MLSEGRGSNSPVSRFQDLAVNQSLINDRTLFSASQSLQEESAQNRTSPLPTLNLPKHISFAPSSTGSPPIFKKNFLLNSTALPN